MKTDVHFWSYFAQLLQREINVKGVGMAGHVNKHDGGGWMTSTRCESHVNNPLDWSN